ncbi:DNA-binding HxlR family transcriptional regulator [Fontibacillus solani]|uniref:DNA-binding HxlR family transcriptional regulator n=1 Tax=Fontibacillus solani TaxID=1572857 RepID=A0A7W3XUI9_9BACL|nr:helix-turn-helix domain-containing protein [Fontibacillus solani]MBA9088760.1 DNA-binding HxlR family transcriptional regulator [Fontibacillus solani]
MNYAADLENLCPATFAFHVIGGKWNLPILAILCKNKSIRYNELKRNLNGITGSMLTNCLKELTESGERLVPIIESIVCWGEQNLDLLKAPQASD